jgi:hypothetical protein
MPKLSYSVVSFSRTDNAIVSPWGQAFSLLADVAAFPRKALTGSFFLRGLKVPEDDLIEAMNVADDALLLAESRRAGMDQLTGAPSAGVSTPPSLVARIRPGCAYC